MEEKIIHAKCERNILTLRLSGSLGIERDIVISNIDKILPWLHGKSDKETNDIHVYPQVLVWRTLRKDSGVPLVWLIDEYKAQRREKEKSMLHTPSEALAMRKTQYDTEDPNKQEDTHIWISKVDLLHMQKTNDEVDQLRVQLAGCLTAAEGGSIKPGECEKGIYGWSPAFEAVKKLRLQYDAMANWIKAPSVKKPSESASNKEPSVLVELQIEDD